MSTNSVSPQTFLGGTWTRIQDRFLLCAGSTYTAGNTGGSATHTLSINEIPGHTHTQQNYSKNYDNGQSIPSGRTYSISYGTSSGNWAYNGTSSSINNAEINAMAETMSTGGGAAHNNMPPYLVVYCWNRTA